MSKDVFRDLLKGTDYPIYYHAPTVIMIIGKTGRRFREIDCSPLCGEHDACCPDPRYRQLLDLINKSGVQQ